MNSEGSASPREGRGRDLEPELEWLRELNVALEQAESRDLLCEAMIEKIVRRYGARAGVLIVRDSLGQGMRLCGSLGMEPEQLDAVASMDLNALADRAEPILCERDEGFHELQERLNRGGGTVRWSALPLHFRSRTLGVLLMAGADEHAPDFPSYSLSRLLGVELGRYLSYEHVSTALDESERRCRRIYENSKDVFYETTTQGRFVDVNQSGVDLFGFKDKQELLSLESIAELYYNAEDRIRFREQIERDGYVKDYEVRFQTKQGKPIDVLITSNVRKDADGRVLGYEGMIKDITRRKNLERKLAESEANYRLMVENSTDGIAIYSEDGLLFANQAFLSMFGYERKEDVKHRDIIEFIAPNSRFHFLEMLHSKEAKKGTPEMFEGEGLKADGTAFAVEISAFPTQFAGKEVQQVTFRDVTQKREMERQLIQDERLRAMGKLAFDIAHEINNPLGGIITYSYLMLESEELPSSERENLEKIIKLANRCKIIVRGLLDFARDDSDQRELVDANRVLRDALFLLERHILFRDIRLELNLDPDLPSILGTRNKLEQVFLNMILNAAEAMEGSGELVITTRLKPEDHWIQIVFKDTGPGVEEEHLQNLFQPFFTTKKRGRGTGLGLSISHGIIKQHGGRILVRSEPGKGCEFTIELPC